MKAIFTLLVLLVVLFNSFLAQEIKTGMEWASTVEAKQMTSPLYNGISYKIISDNPFKKTMNGQPFSNNCLIFPSVTAVNTSPIIKISVVFNKKIDSLKMRIIDLDENTNSNSDPEEFISDIMPKPYKVKNILNQNPIFLYGNVVSPDDNNSATDNNNASGWVMWDLPIDTVTFSYNRPGNLYGIIIDSIYSLDQSIHCNESFDLGNNLVLCKGENTLVSPLSFIQGDYLWNTLDTTKSISVSKQGWYHLTVTNQQCIYKDSIYITVNPVEIKTQTINLTKCLNESITLTSPVIGTNYHWSNSETKSYINISDFNTYVVIVNNYCKIDSIIFNVNDQKCICNFNIQDLKICKNEKITVGFENDPAKFYNWNTNEKSSKILIEKSGVYWLNISDGKCSYRDTFKVELTKENVKFHTLTLDKCLDEKIEITPTFFGDSCIWYNGKKDWTISVYDSGIYHLNVFSKCQIDSIVYKVNNKPCECMLFIPNTFTPNADELNNSFKAVLECDYSNFHMLIFNRWGEIIFESFNVNYGWDGTYNDKIVQDGVYIYKVEYTNHATKQNFEHVGHLNLLK